MATLTIRHERWPIRGTFTISRGGRTATDVVLVELAEEGVVGRGECVPYPRYGENPESVSEDIESRRRVLEGNVTPHELLDVMPAGAAREAVDSALWDLAAKREGARVWELLELPEPGPVITAYTLGLGTPEEMRQGAEEAAPYPLLKLKLGSGDLELDVARVEAVRAARPDARIVVDANEAWSMEALRRAADPLKSAGVRMIEQPLPAEMDAALESYRCPVTLCADESAHDTRSFESLPGRYGMINIKLGKTGGLTEALRLKARAEEAGLGIMVGCMVGTSLSMAPATLVAQGAEVVDLDGPLLLERDRQPGLDYDGAELHPPHPELWG